MTLTSETIVGSITSPLSIMRVEFEWYKKMHPSIRADVVLLEAYRDEVLHQCPDKTFEISEREYWTLKNALERAERKARRG